MMSHTSALKAANAGLTCDINNYFPIPIAYSENAVSVNRIEIQNSFVVLVEILTAEMSGTRINAYAFTETNHRPEGAAECAAAAKTATKQPLDINR